MKYRVNWKYASGLGGPWQEGDIVEIDHEAEAEAINRDSPSVLTLAKPPKAEPPAGEAPEAGEGERQVTHASDRAMRSPGKNRAGGR